jgi:hypothetical protein
MSSQFGLGSRALGFAFALAGPGRGAREVMSLPPARVRHPTRVVSVETVFDLGLEVESSTFGLGDIFVQPVWLGWGGKHWDAAFGYGVYAPTGRYEGGADDNLGLGFWGHQLQATGAWYPFENRATAFVLTGTYEIHGNIEDADVTPGDRVTVNGGVSQCLPATPDMTWLFEVGVSGSSQWEIEEDRAPTPRPSRPATASTPPASSSACSRRSGAPA